MSLKSICELSASESLEVMLTSVVLVSVLAELQEENKLQECRAGVRMFWKGALNDELDKVQRAASELTVDQFFVWDGDMIKARSIMRRDIAAMVPETRKGEVLEALAARVNREKKALLEALPARIQRWKEANAKEEATQ